MGVMGLESRSHKCSRCILHFFKDAVMQRRLLKPKTAG